MMFSHNEKISLRQFQMLIILNIFGTSVITLPRTTAELAGQNGWFLIIGATAIMAVYSWWIGKLADRFPNQTFVEFSQTVFTKPIGLLLSYGLLIKLLLGVGLQLRIFCEIMKQTMLMKTPVWVTGLLLLFVANYLVGKGYECRARAGEILLIVMMIPLVIVFIIACFHTDFTNLLPAFTITGTTFVKGSVWTVFAFQGLEMVMLAFPFLEKPKGIKRQLSEATLTIGILFTLTTIITIARFGGSEVTAKLWPVLQIMDTIDIPGSFIERQDVVFLRFLVISVFAAISAGIYFIAFICSRLGKTKHSINRFAWISLPIILIISCYPSSVEHAYRLFDLLTRYFGLFYFIIVPIALLILSRKQGKGDKSNE